jgi:hypothetical protein
MSRLLCCYGGNRSDHWKHKREQLPRQHSSNNNDNNNNNNNNSNSNSTITSTRSKSSNIINNNNNSNNNNNGLFARGHQDPLFKTPRREELW